MNVANIDARLCDCYHRFQQVIFHRSSRTDALTAYAALKLSLKTGNHAGENTFCFINVVAWIDLDDPNPRLQHYTVPQPTNHGSSGARRTRTAIKTPNLRSHTPPFLAREGYQKARFAERFGLRALSRFASCPRVRRSGTQPRQQRRC